jgi:hypothetical protein
MPVVCTEVGTMPFVCTEVGTKSACCVYRDYITEITCVEIQRLPPGPVLKGKLIARKKFLCFSCYSLMALSRKCQ